MASEEEKILFQVLKESQGKYTYFLLATAAAAIAFALNQTQNLRIAWPQLPVGLAVLSWGISFFCGCNYLAYVNSTLFANYNLIQIQMGKHFEVGDHPQLKKAAGEGTMEAIEKNSNTANKYAKSQFRCLVAGAIFYISWHIVRMAV